MAFVDKKDALKLQEGSDFQLFDHFFDQKSGRIGQGRLDILHEVVQHPGEKRYLLPPE